MSHTSRLTRVGRKHINEPVRFSLRRNHTKLLLHFGALTLCLTFGCAGRSVVPPGAVTKDAAKEITVAAAANLTEAFDEVGRQFTERTGIKVTYSFGGTADLAKQIENDAPFDVFAAADLRHVDQLRDKGLLIAETRAVYARGRLVLWVPSTRAGPRITRLEDLTRADVKNVAIAKPDLAPYGAATVEALRALNLWPRVEVKAVYAQNVSQTKQFASTGNADAAFIPLALVKTGEGEAIEVDEHLHGPINQAIGVVKATNRLEPARRFVDFVLSEEGQALLGRYGYRRPDTSSGESR